MIELARVRHAPTRPGRRSRSARPAAAAHRASASRTAASAPPRSPDLRRRGQHDGRAQAIATQHGGRERAVERDDLRRAAATAGRMRSAMRASARRRSGSRRDSAGARRSCARAGGSARPRGPRSAIVEIVADRARRRDRGARAGAGSTRAAQDRRRALAAVEHVDELGELLELLAGLLGVLHRARADRRRGRLISIGAGLPARSASTSCSTWTYSKRASGTSRVQLARGRVRSPRRCRRASPRGDEPDHDVAACSAASRSPARARCRCGA